MSSRNVVVLIAAVLLFAVGTVNAENYREAFEFLSPKPGAEFVNRGTYIVIRPGDNLSNYSFNYTSPVYIEGQISGVQEYDVKTALDGKTLNIIPHALFEAGERVVVIVDNGLKARTAESSGDFIYHFTVAPEVPPAYDDDYYYPDLNVLPNPVKKNIGDLLLDRDEVLPSDWPEIVTTTPGTPGSGYIFTAYNNPDNSGYLMILDDAGDPVFYRKSEINMTRPDVPFSGIITYGEVLKKSNEYDNKWFAMNQFYNVIDTFEMIGYELDSHGFQLNQDWHSFMFTYDYQIIDMSDSVEGGDPACRIEGFIIQELDSLKNLVFQWSNWDNLNVMDCQHFDMTSNRINATHINGLDFDYDGNILISLRGYCECMKIDVTTGDIAWRLTKHGPNSSFNFVNDTAGFCWQHNMRPTGTGTYTVYDNGCFHTPQFSRVVEYDLDTTAWTAALVWEYRPSPDIYTAVGGDAQRLPNGNTMVGFSDNFKPPIREVHADGSTALEVDFNTDPFSSPSAGRRFPWTGIAAVPYLLPELNENGVRLIFNKFGDGAIDEYVIYWGEFPNPTSALDTTANNYYDITDLVPGYTYYARVTAIDYSSFESDYSNEESITWFAPYVPGDANSDGLIIGSDVTFLVNYFRGIATPPDSCWNANAGDWLYTAADANGDCLNIGSDVTLLVNYFRGTGEISWCEDTPPYGY